MNVYKKRQNNPHSLGPNKITNIPYQAIFVDTETKPITLNDKQTEQVFKLGWAAYWRPDEEHQDRNTQWFEIPSPTAFWDWMESKTYDKQKLYLFAHNLYFDFSVLKGQTELIKRGWKPSLPYYQGHTAIHRWRKRKMTLQLLDTGNYFPGALKHLGKSIGLPKLEIDFSHCTDEELSAYCQRDVEIIYQAMMLYFKFIAQHDLGGFRATAPSQAFNAYRHRFMHHKIWIHKNPEAHTLERNSYHGGHTEMFYQGILTDGPYYKLDFNSAYPSVYGRYDYPYNLLKIVDDFPLDALSHRLKKECVIAEVGIQTNEPAYPYLYKNRLLYPIGRFTTTLTTRELSYALAHEHLTHVYKATFYQKAPLFAEYVNEFYKLRLQYKHESNTSFELMVKLMLNALYGKWGQHKILREIIGDTNPNIFRLETAIDVDTNQIVHIVTYGGKKYVERKEGEAHNSFPAIAAHITADLRMKLWKTMKLAGRKNVYYCDTDSLIVNQQGFHNIDRLQHPDRLGALKVEERAHKVELYAPKDYVFGKTVKRKGVPSNAKQITPSTFSYDEFQGWRGAMRAGEVGKVVTIRTLKRLFRTVNQGKLTPSGWIKPYNLPDDIYIELEPRKVKHQEKIWQEIKQSVPKIPQKIMLAVWDYKRGDFRQARDKNGKLVPIIYSKWDSLASELGFEDIDAFLHAVENQANPKTRKHK